MDTLREEAHRLVDQLPEGASWDDLMYQIYVRQKIEAGRRAIAEGRFVSQDEAERRMAKWLER
jgi:predicted transcriptional regulator